MLPGTFGQPNVPCDSHVQGQCPLPGVPGHEQMSCPSQSVFPDMFGQPNVPCASHVQVPGVPGHAQMSCPSQSVFPDMFGQPNVPCASHVQEPALSGHAQMSCPRQDTFGLQPNALVEHLPLPGLPCHAQGPPFMESQPCLQCQALVPVQAAGQAAPPNQEVQFRGQELALNQPTTHTAQQQPGNVDTLAKAKPKACPTIVRPSSEGDLSSRPVLITLNDQRHVVATVSKPANLVEWEWARAVQAVGLKDKKDYRLLQRNKKALEVACAEAEICYNQIHYRGKGEKDRGRHHMESNVFILLLLWLVLNRRVGADVKAKALTLVLELLKLATSVLPTAVAFVGMAFADNMFVYESLAVDSTGCVANLSQLLFKSAAAMALWNKLMKEPFCSKTICSSHLAPTLWDLVLLLVCAKNNISQGLCWANCGQLLWPKVLFVCGHMLDMLAVHRAQGELTHLPLLKSKKGHTRRVPWVNKLLLLRKLRKKKLHRKDAAETHGDMVPERSALVTSENFLCASIYSSKLKAAFQKTHHVAVHLDPSTYDCSTMVSVLFSAEAGQEGHGLAAYLPVQNMSPVLKDELCKEVQELGAINKLTRIDGFNELRALSHSVQAVDKPLQQFKVNSAIKWQALAKHEVRVWEDGQFFIVDELSGQKVQQLPLTFDIGATPVLISVSDQGGINRAGLDFLTHRLHLLAHIAWDPFHRGYNDLKSSLKQAKGHLFKAMLAYSLVWNSGYGPAGSKEWFHKKQARAKELVSTSSPDEEPFASYLPYICMERQIEEPSTPAEKEKLFQGILQLNCATCLGPVAKLMRWYSWFETEAWHSGETWCQKLLMQGSAQTIADSAEFVCEGSAPSAKEGMSDKQELQALKNKFGTWALVPKLITPASMFEKDIIACLAKPSWTHHAYRSKHILTPQQVAAYTIDKCQGAWKDEVVALILQAFHTPDVMKKLYPVQANVSPATLQQRVEIHVDFSVRFAGKRCQSLVAAYLIPPTRYVNMLDSASHAAAKAQMKSEWLKLLEGETGYNGACQGCGEHALFATALVQIGLPLE